MNGHDPETNDEKEKGEKKQELVEELLDNQFTFGIFSLTKYEKMAEKNPKKAYILAFGPVITALIVLVLVFWTFVKN